jgi:hypothetical protein
VRAGEAWWIGRDEQFSTAVDGLCPPSLDMSQMIREATVKTGANRDGVGFSVAVLKKAQPVNLQYSLWKEAKMIELASEEAVSRANAALTGLEDHLAKFRSKVGNDLTSIKAASQRVQTESQAMTEKYVKARDMLTSPEFERAILNAERMATALEAIGRLSETKLSFAVFSGSSQPS